MKLMLLVLLCLGALSAMNGCYIEPYPYDDGYEGSYVPYYYGPSLRFYGNFYYYNHPYGHHRHHHRYHRHNRYRYHHHRHHYRRWHR
jgi:hypothetical protein